MVDEIDNLLKQTNGGMIRSLVPVAAATIFPKFKIFWDPPFISFAQLFVLFDVYAKIYL